MPYVIRYIVLLALFSISSLINSNDLITKAYLYKSAVIYMQ